MGHHRWFIVSEDQQQGVRIKSLQWMLPKALVQDRGRPGESAPTSSIVPMQDEVTTWRIAESVFAEGSFCAGLPPHD